MRSGPRPKPTAKTEAASGQFETMILDNLRKAGVQNTIKNERLKFDALEPFAGRLDSCGGRVHRQQRARSSEWPSPSARNMARSARSR